MKFLFTMMFTNDLGLPNRTLPVALELAGKGHEIAFCNIEDAPKKLFAKAGVTNLKYRERGLPTVIPPFAQPWDMDHFYSYYGYMDEDYLRQDCAGMIEVMEDYSPDVIVDSWGLSSCIAARVLKKPLVSILQADMHPAGSNLIWWDEKPKDLPTPVPIVNRVLADYGLDPVKKTDDLHVGDLTLIAGTPETDPLPEGTDVTYVGPILYQKEGAKLPDEIEAMNSDKPILWVYTATPRYFEPFVTIGDSVVVMRACIEALADEDFQVVLTTGYRDLPSETTSLPKNFHYEAYVPGIEMAKKSDLIIHHGGHGASLTGPYTDTPAVIIPTFSERESNARRIFGLGAAEIIVPKENEEMEKHVSAEELREKIGNVLSDPSYKENAQQLGKKMRKYKGALEAVQRIEAFV